MAILNAQGEAIEDVKEYRVSTFAIQTAKPPEFFLQLALQQAVEKFRHHDPMTAMRVKNPFQIEPGAQALLMLVADALKAQDERIAELEAKLAGSDESSPNEQGS